MFSISRFASANSLRRLRNSVSFCLNFALSASDGWLLTRPLAIFSVYGSSIIFCCIFLVRFETYVAAIDADLSSASSSLGSFYGRDLACPKGQTGLGSHPQLPFGQQPLASASRSCLQAYLDYGNSNNVGFSLKNLSNQFGRVFRGRILQTLSPHHCTYFLLV